MKRRHFLQGGAALGLAPAAPGLAFGDRMAKADPLRTGIDRDRASHIMAKFGLDALCLGEPVNVRYAIGQMPFSGRTGLDRSSFAIIPKEPAETIKYVSSQPRFYLTQTDTQLNPGVEPILAAGAPDGGEPQAFFFTDPQEGELTAKEKHRRAGVMAAAPFVSSLQAGLTKALAASAGPSGRIGYDSLAARLAIETSTPSVSPVDGLQAVLHMRLVKTPEEIELMRMASASNIKAAQLAAATLRGAPTALELRRAFESKAAALGNKPVFLVIDGSIAETYDAEFADGAVLLIDCVSEYQGYHGDFGRTIFRGEPRARVSRKVDSIALAWMQLAQELKPGMRFSQIAARGQAILKSIDPYLLVPFRPHSVGLAHTEHPAIDASGAPLDVQLEPGMIISVDCPLLEAIPEGSVHLEDLMLITADGAQPIHDVTAPFITV